MHSIILIEGKYNVNCTFDTSIIVQAYNAVLSRPNRERNTACTIAQQYAGWSVGEGSA